MSARHSRALLAVVLLLLAGCSRMEGMATRYRAERMAWEAQREETRLRIGKAAPDSATILKIRDGYARVRAAFPPPFVKGSGAKVEKQRRDIARAVGTAELTASRLAIAARRGDLALESARWVASIAEGDSALRREADFATVMALRGLRRYDEAIATLRGMLDRYPPISPPSMEQEDQILTLPDALIELRTEIGDIEGAKREQALAAAYFRKLLERKPPPFLEAQIRARLSRTLLEIGDPNMALAEVEALRDLVERTPALKKLEPELLYTEARIRSMQKDHKKALDLYDLALMKHPGSPFAQRALLDAAVISERLGDREGAIARYRSILGRPKPDLEVAPVASFRLAMVQDQAGNWAEAKQILEAIPLRFPRSRAAIEAPFAVVEHYVRSRKPEAAKASLLRAVDTYRAMIDRDSTSMYSTVYRWNVLRAYSALERWKDALATVDLMAERDKGAPITAEALYQGARMARTLGDKAKSDIYLNRIVLEYPRSPRAGSIRKFLGRTSGAAADPAKK